jgi:hypothetical protein
MTDLAAAITDSLSRSGKGGMSAPLAMNGYKIVSVGFATEANDVPQATQIRDQAFSNVTVTVDASGNNYVGTALLATPLSNGGSYNFHAFATNTGPMTLAINGSAALPILINGAPVPPGLVRNGAIVTVFFSNLTFLIAGVVAGATGTVNSVQSSDPALISVVNDTGTNIATLTPHSNVAGGMTKLDSSGKVPIIQLPFTDIHFVGVWNAAPGVLPSTSGIFNGNFYVITVAGTLTLFRVTAGGNVYTAQATPVAVGDAIILRVGSTNPNAPDGWYYDPQSSTVVAASTVVMNATPTLPAVTDAQSWMNQMDPIIAGKLPKAGGTMTGPIIQPALPATANELANRQYVDNKTAALVGVLSFNSRTGAVGLTSSDVTGALGYAPANLAGANFSGGINAPSVASAGFVTSGKGFYTSPSYGFIAFGDVTVDFNNGQSQIYYLNAATNITAVNNIPGGAILRLVIANTNIPLTWPASVHWPLGVTPSFGAGPLKRAIVVLENDDGSNILATASIY